MTEAEPDQNRAGQLDAIRAFAVLAVVFSHTIPETYRIGDFMFFEFGAYGVYIFFVLSGYLITGQLLATQHRRLMWGEGIGRPLGLFYVRRVLRLFPAYYLAVLGAAMLDLPCMRMELPWHLLQLSDILFALDPVAEEQSTAGHLWSLTVEWQFYLVWPVALLLSPARLVPWLVAVLGLVGLFAWGCEEVLNPVVYRSNMLQSFDSLAFGAALAVLQARGARLGWLRAAGWAGALLYAVQIAAYMRGDTALGDAMSVPGHEGMNLAFAAIVHRASQGFGGRTGRVLDAPSLHYLGLISYGIYVYHMFILAVFEQVLARLGWGGVPWGAGLTVALFATSTAAAALSWRLIERPVNRQRRRFGHLPPAVPATATGLPA